MKIFAPLNSESLPQLQEIEVATFFQIPTFQIIGLPSPEVAEARERVRSAISQSGLEFPRRKVVLNLSPASIRKRGTGIDLAMALAIVTPETLPRSPASAFAAWGELGLDGTIKPVGQLTRTLFACWSKKIPFLILSLSDYNDASAAIDLMRKSQSFPTFSPPTLIPVKTLREAWKWVSEGTPPQHPVSLFDSPIQSPTESPTGSSDSTSSSLLNLTPALERILGISAAGRHHILLLGPRGTGKSHALDWLASLLPATRPQDLLQRKLLAELGNHQILPSDVRRISSQVKPSALLGMANAQTIRPGEFSLAHGGLLIADEFPEWPRDSREALREPLEHGSIHLTRAQGSVQLPAEFLFAGSGNLCPCGGYPPHLPTPVAATAAVTVTMTTTMTSGVSVAQQCRCTFSARKQYLARLSGPVLDRVDLIAPVDHLHHQLHQLHHHSDMNARADLIREKVSRSQTSLISLWGTPPGRLQKTDLELILNAHPEWQIYLSECGPASLRSRHKILRLALTLGAWDETSPQKAHFIEASFYRPEYSLPLQYPSL